MANEAKFYNGVDLGGQKGINAAPGVAATDLVIMSQLGSSPASNFIIDGGSATTTYPANAFKIDFGAAT